MCTTDNPHEKVNVWICARRTTHHDLVSVIPDEKNAKEKKRKDKYVTVVMSMLLSFLFHRLAELCTGRNTRATPP